MRRAIELISLFLATTFFTSCQTVIRKSFCEQRPYSPECGCIYFFDKANAERDFSLDRIDELLYCDQLYYARPKTGIDEILNQIYSRPPAITPSDQDQN